MSPKATATKTKTEAVPQSQQSKLAFGFTRSRKKSVPIVQAETPDPSATINVMLRTALDVCKEYGEPEPAFVQWDCVRGLRHIDPLGRPEKEAAQAPGYGALQNAEKKSGRLLSKSDDLITALEIAFHLPENAVIFIQNAHLFLHTAGVLQATWNLRDHYKINGRTLVLLGAYFHTPLELQGDVISLLEELPDREALRKVVTDQFINAELIDPTGKAKGKPTAVDETVMAKALDALIGLSMFTAEQVTAMSLMADGLDLEMLWEHKVNAIKQTPGLSVYRGNPETDGLDKVKGCDNVVQYLRELIDADAFGVIGFIDEGEKAMAGGMADFSGDSGVAKDQMSTFLTFANDKAGFGLLFAGISGTGKTFLARAAAATAGKPMITIDFGAMKTGTVGESEGRLRTALKVLEAIAGGPGRIMLIMTANKTTIFSPEMNRRFPDQFFFDNPDAEARKALWDVYLTRDELVGGSAAIPEGWDEGWTGDEIQRVCTKARLLKKSVVEASRWLIPSAKAHRDKHQALREEANDRFLSATHAGWYKAPKEAPKVHEKMADAEFAQLFAVQMATGMRKLKLEEMN